VTQNLTSCRSTYTTCRNRQTSVVGIVSNCLTKNGTLSSTLKSLKAASIQLQLVNLTLGALISKAPSAGRRHRRQRRKRQAVVVLTKEVVFIQVVVNYTSLVSSLGGLFPAEQYVQRIAHSFGSLPSLWFISFTFN
jgi:hypothetical protein